MELMEALKARQSVRSYEAKPIPEEKLSKILEAARLSPSAGNRQGRKFVVVKDRGKREQLARAANHQSFIAEAPVVIAAVATLPRYTMSCGIPAYTVDVAIAVDHMTLAAADEGLGTCWIGAFSQERVREILDVPEKYVVVTLLPVGYPRTEKLMKSRKPLKEIVCYESFSE